jgi:PilZ domain
MQSCRIAIRSLAIDVTDSNKISMRRTGVENTDIGTTIGNASMKTATPLRLANEIPARSRHSQPGIGQSEVPYKDLKPLIRICADLHAVSRLTATCTSILNAVADHTGPHVRISTVVDYMPPVPTWSAWSGADGNVSILNFELALQLEQFAQRLDFVRNITIRFVTTEPENEETAAATLFIVRDAWIAISEICRALLNDGHNELSYDTPDFLANQKARLTATLDGVIAGQWPCVQRDGSIEIPDWAERRRSQRQLVRIPVVVRSTSKVFEALARDLSVGGLCLDGVDEHLIEADRVTVTFPGARSLAASVVWTDGIRAGFRFARPLQLTDPLLQQQSST